MSLSPESRKPAEARMSRGSTIRQARSKSGAKNGVRTQGMIKAIEYMTYREDKETCLGTALFSRWLSSFPVSLQPMSEKPKGQLVVPDRQGCG